MSVVRPQTVENPVDAVRLAGRVSLTELLANAHNIDLRDAIRTAERVSLTELLPFHSQSESH